MFKKIFNYIKELIIEEYKFIIFMILTFIILNIPMNYYIIVGGGISNAEKRITVDKASKSKGSFNISYVTQLDGNLLTYCLSYIVPKWEREDANLYKYDEDESVDDIEFRSNLDLKTANSTATYWAYKLANKSIKEKNRKLYVIATFPKEYYTDLKVADEIISMDGKSYETVEEYSKYIQTKNKDDEIVVKVKRKNKEKDIKTKVYEYEGYKILGITLQYVKEYETSPTLKIKFKRSESGPSAGLVTTLEIYNQLTKKDITKGKTIAGTGTIEEDGTIGEIGGIEHKILGASHAKADIFLSPAGENYKTAKKYIKKKNIKIKLIEVKNIEDAIEKLEKLEK